jgi:hypothetical protein
MRGDAQLGFGTNSKKGGDDSPGFLGIKINLPITMMGLLSTAEKFCLLFGVMLLLAFSYIGYLQAGMCYNCRRSLAIKSFDLLAIRTNTVCFFVSRRHSIGRQVVLKFQGLLAWKTYIEKETR